MSQDQEPVTGDKAVQRMLQESLNRRNPSQDSKAGEDPIEKARQLSRELVADSIVANTLAKSKAETAEAEAKVIKAEAEAKKAEAGADKGEGAESGFKLKGSFDMGNFNFLEQLNQQRTELATLKTDAEKQAQTQAGISDDLREKLHAKEIEVLQTNFSAQMQVLTEMIKANASKGSFMDQYNATREVATQLGYVAPGTQATDLQTTLELKKMEFEQTTELRKMARDERKSDRDFQIELRRLDDERDGRKADQTRQDKRDDMIAGAPAMIGRAIGKALAEGGGEEASGITSGRGAKYEIEVAPGAGGEMDCPKEGCGEVIGIGPTARTAVCAKCGAKVHIKRTAGAETGERSREEE